MCVSGYMLLTIRAGRSNYFFIFCNNFVCLKYVFIKTELQYIDLHFSVCHMVSQPIAPSFSMANSLISSDMLSTARERYKNTSTKVIFNIGCNRNRLETENKNLLIINQK